MHNLITHSLALYTCENTSKKFWFSFFLSIECAPWLVEKIKKFELDHLPGSRYSIASRSIEKSNSIDRLAIEYQLIKKDWSLFHSIDRKQFSTYWNSWNLNFQKFSKVVFYGFSWTNNHHMNIIDREWYQNWISLIL